MLPMTSAEVGLQQFVATQKRLLALELRAEEEVSLTSSSTASGRSDNEGDRGSFLRNVAVIDVSIGLYGRTVVSFGNDSAETKLLQSHRLTVGDEVAILAKSKGSQLQSLSKKSKSIGGVICTVSDFSISVALFGDSKQKQQPGAKDTTPDTVDDDLEMLGGPP